MLVRYRRAYPQIRSSLRVSWASACNPQCFSRGANMYTYVPSATSGANVNEIFLVDVTFVVGPWAPALASLPFPNV